MGGLLRSIRRDKRKEAGSELPLEPASLLSPNPKGVKDHLSRMAGDGGRADSYGGGIVKGDFKARFRTLGGSCSGMAGHR